MINYQLVMVALFSITSIFASTAVGSSDAVSSHLTSAPFSDIFSYEGPRLHARMTNSRWSIEDIKREHIGFHQDLFANPIVMSRFGDGQVRDRSAVRARCENSIEKRFGEGHPHGLMTVSDPGTTFPFMHLVGGGGDRAGTSEIAYAMIPDYQEKKIGTQVVSCLVQTWAPEVRRIGLGTGLDPVAQSSIISNFQCFGGASLDQLDATASPANPSSWVILDRLGFKAAGQGVASSEVVVDLDGREFGTVRKDQYILMEEHLLSLFDPAISDAPLKSGQRYLMTDPAGVKRTFSKHERYARLKYHLEKAVS